MEKSRIIGKAKGVFRRPTPEVSIDSKRIVGAPDALQPTVLEAQFLGVVEELKEGMDDASVDAVIHDRARQYLEDNGISEADDPDIFDANYHLIRHIAYHSRDKWREHEDAIGKTPEAYMKDDLEKRYSTDAASFQEETERYAKRLAEMLAKRSRDLTFTHKGEIESLKEEFSDMIRATATELYLSQEATRDHDELTQDIEDFLDDQIRLVGNHLADTRLQKAASRNRVVDFAIRKWASWGPQNLSGDHKLFSVETFKQLFSKENLKGNAKKSVVIMGATAVTTAVTAPFVGAAAGVAGVAAGAWAATRVAKSIAVQKISSAGSEERVAEAQRAEMNRLFNSIASEEDDDIRERIRYIDQEMAANLNKGLSNDELVAERADLDSRLQSQQHDRLLDAMTERVDSIWRRNRNRTLGAIGLGLAFGGASAGVLHLIGMTDLPENIRQSTTRLFKGVRIGPIGASDNSPPASPPGSPPGAAAANEGGLPSGGGRGEYHTKPSTEAPVVPPGNLPIVGGPGERKDFNLEEYLRHHQDGLIVTKGEGWNQTFHELGVDKSHQGALLKELGPQLVDKGLAYEIDGKFFINKAGGLPHDTTRLIVETARGHGWLDQSVDAPKTALTDISRGEGVLQSLRDAGMEKPTLDDVAKIGPALERAGVGYHAPDLGGTGLYYHDGVMSEKGVAIFQDYADNKLLDNSVSPESALDTDAKQLDAAVKIFAAENGLDGKVDTIDELMTEATKDILHTPYGLEQVIAAGDINHSGSVNDEVQNYVRQFATNRTNFMDALRDAQDGKGLDKLAKYSETIDMVGKALTGITYENADGSRVPVAVFNGKSGHYELSPMPSGIPESARKLIQESAFRSDYRLAA
ncbi:MAG: hypothetical protein WAU02_00015 [Candidatus Saccharimonadales bacterium]